MLTCETTHMYTHAYMSSHTPMHTHLCVHSYPHVQPHTHVHTLTCTSTHNHFSIQGRRNLCICSLVYIHSLFIAYRLTMPLLSCTADALSSHGSPVMANEKVVPVRGSDGHHLIWVDLEHLLHRLHLLLAIYANFYGGASETDTK